MNHKGVYRTAPDTPGLSKITSQFSQPQTKTPSHYAQQAGKQNPKKIKTHKRGSQFCNFIDAIIHLISKNTTTTKLTNLPISQKIPLTTDSTFLYVRGQQHRYQKIPHNFFLISHLSPLMRHIPFVTCHLNQFFDKKKTH